MQKDNLNRIVMGLVLHKQDNKNFMPANILKNIILEQVTLQIQEQVHMHMRLHIALKGSELYRVSLALLIFRSKSLLLIFELSIFSKNRKNITIIIFFILNTCGTQLHCMHTFPKGGGYVYVPPP